MSIDKFLTVPDRKQHVNDIRVGHFKYGEDDIPIVVCGEPDRVVFSWWNKFDDGQIGSKWESIERQVQQDDSSTSIWEFNPWSQRIGLAVTGTQVIITYKRCVGDTTTLFLDHFTWHPSERIFKRKTDSPIPVPNTINLEEKPRAGFYHWTGYDVETNKLIILAQVTILNIRNSVVLNLLSVDFSDENRDLTNTEVWKNEEIGIGAYELDASIKDGHLFCVYREEPTAIIINHPSISSSIRDQINFADLDGVTTAYPALKIKKISLTDMACIEEYSDVPGGENPQIQSIDPLILSCDRPHIRNIIVLHEASGTVRLKANITGFKKKLLFYDEDHWCMGNLLSSDLNLLPRPVYIPLHSSDRDEGFLFKNDRIKLMNGDCCYTVAFSRIPTYLVALEPPQEEKEPWRLEFLYHWPVYNGLVRGRFNMRPDGSSLDMNYSGYWIVDINHHFIPSHRQGRPRYVENAQFSPFRAELELENEDRIQWFDSTLGGRLTAMSIDQGKTLIAYTDLGDEGVRVILPQTLPDIPPAHPDKKMNPEVVPNPDHEHNVWNELTSDNGQWQSADLPAIHYLRPNDEYQTIASGLDLKIDELFKYFPSLTNTDNTLFVARREVLEEIIYEELRNDGIDMSEDDDRRKAVSESNKIWVNLCLPIESIPDNEYIGIFNTEVRIGKYLLQYQYSENQAPDAREIETISIEVQQNYNSLFKFQSNIDGQGFIDYCFRIEISSEDILIKSLLEPLITIPSFIITFDYWRTFTPCILMTDQRIYDPSSLRRYNKPVEATKNSDTRKMWATALSAKPFTPTRVGDFHVDANVVLQPLTHIAIPAIIAVIVAFGLIGLLGMPLWVAVAMGVVAFIAVYTQLQPIIRRIINGTIRNSLEHTQNRADIKESLDETHLFVNAGEGLMESIARKILNNMGETVENDRHDGKNRIKDQYWQTIIVSENKCRVLVRPH